MPNSVVIYKQPSDLTDAIAKRIYETQRGSDILEEREIWIIIVDMILDSNMHLAFDQSTPEV